MIIVTGASKGIGRAMTEQLLSLTSDLILVIARSREALDQLAALHLERVHAIAGDVTETKAQSQSRRTLWQEVVAFIEKRGGHVKAIYHAAGIMPELGHLREEDSLAKVQAALQVNLYGIMEGNRRLLPYLKKNSHIVCLSSGAGTRPYQAWAPYCISKAALNMYVQCFAVENPTVRILAVRPGVVKSDMTDAILKAGKGLMSDTDYAKVEQNRIEAAGPARALVSLLQKEEISSGSFISWDDQRLSR